MTVEIMDSTEFLFILYLTYQRKKLPVIDSRNWDSTTKSTTKSDQMTNLANHCVGTMTILSWLSFKVKKNFQSCFVENAYLIAATD